MEVIIKSKFQDSEIVDLADEIARYIAEEKTLTDRDSLFIQKLLCKRNVHIAFVNKNIKGFVMLKPVYKDTKELISLWVDPEYRGNGIAIKLLSNLLSNHQNPVYLFTFTPDHFHLWEKFGFERRDLFKLPLILLLKILFSRKLSSYLRHFSQEKSYLFVRGF